MNRLFLLLSFCIALALPAHAQTTDPKKLDELSEQQKAAEQKASALLKQQSAVQQEISGLRKDLVTATAQSRGYEQAQTRAQQRLSALEREEEQLSALILSDRDALSDMLAALQRIERRPPPSLLSNSKTAVDAARAARLLSSLSRDLQT